MPVLERALSEIVRRHEILRTRFADEDGRPVQVVELPRPLTLEVVDLRSLAAGARDAEAKRLVDEETATSFDLTRGPLFRARLLRLEERDHVLHLLFDHLVFDGFSKLVLFRELDALYAALADGGGSPLPEPQLQYGDFAEWQRSWLQGELLERELAHWQEELAGMPTTLELPTDHARPAVASMRGAWLRTTLPAPLVAALQALAQQEGTTVYVALLAAFDLLLHRYSGQDDIALGMPVDARDRPELEGAIGVFVDTVVLRVDLSGNPTFRTLLERVRTRMLDAIAHQRLPFEQLVRAVEPDRDLARHPLYQVMLTLVPADAPPALAGLDVEEVAPERGSSPIDLTVFVEPRGDALEAVWEYSTDLFARTTIERMQGHFLRLLEAIVAQPDRPAGELPMLSEAERTDAVTRWSAGGGEYPVACLHELFEAKAAAAPRCAGRDLRGRDDLLRRAERAREPARAPPARPRRRARGPGRPLPAPFARPRRRDRRGSEGGRRLRPARPRLPGGPARVRPRGRCAAGRHLAGGAASAPARPMRDGRCVSIATRPRSRPAAARTSSRWRRPRASHT